MDEQLQQQNLTMLEKAKRKDEDKLPERRGRARDGHALMAVTSSPSTWILDSGASNHMATEKVSFSSIEDCTGPPILMGNDTPVKECSKGIVSLEGGFFNCVLHVPLLSMNLMSIYQITHSGSRRKFEFNPDIVVISEIETRFVLAHSIVDHDSHLYMSFHISF